MPISNLRYSNRLRRWIPCCPLPVRSEQKVSLIPASVVVVSRREIELFGYTDIAEVLRNVPGLYSIEEYDWTGGGQ